jgi:peptidyl-dipeptidase Dcp
MMKINLLGKLSMLGMVFASSVSVCAAPLADNGAPREVTQNSRMNNNMMNQNPFLQSSRLPLGAPDFNAIRPEHYLPAIKEGISRQRAEIDKIVNNKEKATFQNTILAYEHSGDLLNRVSSIFFCVAEADATPEMEKLETEIIPVLTDFGNEISFNDRLFQRIKYVYDNERNSLKGEDRRLLDETYKEFVRSGALLSKDKKARLEQINKRVADLQQQFGSALPKLAEASAVWVNSKEELAGLSEADLAQCKKDAESRGGKAPYCIVITNTTQQPILASLDNRDLRRQVWEASIHRADGTRGTSTFEYVSELARLRAEMAGIMGYDNYAAYSLDDAMAKTPARVQEFLKGLIAGYQPKAKAETDAIEAYARQTEGADFHLQPYDRFYYGAKMKKEKFHFSDDEVKAYFNLDSVLVNGVFYAANKAYGLTFRERTDLPTYHSDMKVFDVFDKDGKQLALFYTDYFRRPTKRGGAWMDAMQKQSLDRGTLPIIYNVCNFAKAPDGQPTLLTWDEVTTVFHEFGHALHGMLSHCNYRSLSGTAVPRDFVEMPSQFNESFAVVPEVFSHFARHYKTHEQMPADLKERMLSSINYQSAYALGENMAATCIDLAWHLLKPEEVPAADAASEFEHKALANVGLLDEQVPPRYYTSYFNHVWGGGYAAGYYSYLWSEVLADNIAEYFKSHGALDPAVGQSFRDKVLSKGNTQDLMEIYTDFTGQTTPDQGALLRARGL